MLLQSIHHLQTLLSLHFVECACVVLCLSCPNLGMGNEQTRQVNKWLNISEKSFPKAYILPGRAGFFVMCACFCNTPNKDFPQHLTESWCTESSWKAFRRSQKKKNGSIGKGPVLSFTYTPCRLIRPLRVARRVRPPARELLLIGRTKAIGCQVLMELSHPIGIAFDL